MEVGRAMASSGAQRGPSREPAARASSLSQGSGTGADAGQSSRGLAQPEPGRKQLRKRLGTSPRPAAWARLTSGSPSCGQQWRTWGLPEGPSRQVTVPGKDEQGGRRQREVTQEGTKTGVFTAASRCWPPHREPWGRAATCRFQVLWLLELRNVTSSGKRDFVEALAVGR